MCLWQKPFKKRGPLWGGKQGLTHCFLFLRALNIVFFFQSWSHCLAHWYVDLHRDFVLFCLSAEASSAETVSHPPPPFMSFCLILITNVPGSPVITLVCRSDPWLSSFNRTLCCDLGIFRPPPPANTTGLCFSSQAAELHGAITCGCVNWGHNKFTLTLAGFLLLGNTRTNFLKTTCGSVRVPKFPKFLHHYPSLPVLPPAS